MYATEKSSCTKLTAKAINEISRKVNCPHDNGRLINIHCTRPVAVPINGTVASNTENINDIIKAK